VVPTSATTPSGVGVTINAGLGNQSDPHVSQNLAAYTDLSSGQIRYYNFLTATDLAISNVTGNEVAGDTLADVYNNSVVFTRQTSLILSRSISTYPVMRYKPLGRDRPDTIPGKGERP